MRIPAACVARDRGYVVLDDENHKAYRVMTTPTYNFLTSDLYKTKENDFWLTTRTTDVKHELLKNDNSYKTMEVDYVDHVIYWTEMSFLDIKECLLFLCRITEYLAKNNMCIQTHLWNVTLMGGKPILIDLGDFFYGANNTIIYESVASHLIPPFTERHTPILPDDWISNYAEIHKNLKEIKLMINSTSPQELINQLKSCILKIKVKNSVNRWDDYPVQNNIPNKIAPMMEYASSMRPTLCKIIKERSPRTLLDLGCSQGLYSFFAAGENIKVIGVDNSHRLISAANQKAQQLGLSCQFALIDLLNFKSTDDNGGYGQCFDRIKSEGVIVPAVIHHVHGKNKPLEQIITEWASMAEKWIMLEYIQKDTSNRSIDLKKITNTLTNLEFINISFLDSNPSPRKWILAEK